MSDPNANIDVRAIVRQEMNNKFRRFFQWWKIDRWTNERLFKIFMAASLVSFIFMGLILNSVKQTQREQKIQSKKNVAALVAQGRKNSAVLKEIRQFTSPAGRAKTTAEINSLVLTIKCDNETTTQKLFLALTTHNQSQVNLLSKECQPSH